MDPWMWAVAALVGGFGAGWVVRGWHENPRVPDAYEDPEPAIPKTKWICPQCQRRRELPSDLDRKVMVCNLCQVRLVRDPQEIP